jgi:hypothetical protein
VLRFQVLIREKGLPQGYIRYKQHRRKPLSLLLPQLIDFALVQTRTYLIINVSICADPTVIGKLKLSTEQISDLQGILRITL